MKCLKALKLIKRANNKQKLYEPALKICVSKSLYDAYVKEYSNK